MCLTDEQFSDEFNTDGRTFYPGDDPYFTAVDIWYGVTQDNEVGAIVLKSERANGGSGTIQMPSPRRTAPSNSASMRFKITF